MSRAEVDLDCGPEEEPAEPCDWEPRRLLTGMRETGGGLRVPELGGVGYMEGTVCELRFGMLGAVCGMSLRLRLCDRVCCLGGEREVADCGCKMSWCDWLRPWPSAIWPSLDLRWSWVKLGRGP